MGNGNHWDKVTVITAWLNLPRSDSSGKTNRFMPSTLPSSEAREV